MDVASLLCTKKSRVQFRPLTEENFLIFFLPIPFFITTSSILPARRAPYEWYCRKKAMKKNKLKLCVHKSKHVRMVMDVASLLCTKKSRVQFCPLTEENFLTFFLPIPFFITMSSILPARRAPYKCYCRKKAMKKNKLKLFVHLSEHVRMVTDVATKMMEKKYFPQNIHLDTYCKP